MPQIEQTVVRNHLLAALPPEDFRRLVPLLTPVPLKLKQILYAADEPIEACYFVESGMVSLLAPLEGGGSMEIGVIGREGLVGLPVLLGAESAPSEALVQGAGTAFHIQASALKRVFDDSVPLRTLLLRYTQAVQIQISQTAVCNGSHTVEERLARWMLMTHDRAEGDQFPMTHEFMSLMLGVRRAGVTTAAGVLKRIGAIDYGQGTMTVLDRPVLESAACECYGIVRQQFERLLGTQRR
ncbi:Crp/Fnr family transcriptional regulator [Azospirillum sp.]|uniref:Crp/Fnr family transcriptional regulator n=1 Tax=Azospirillum sp. TaxID=34012 RepID=UPI002D3EB14F|nr:Crp/Fnr family transcriptional regulator [Azospirillum sp.]HYF89219.1 Crp/Fnr family transcriptional regulator [Azospirillum sp.]